MDGKYVKLFEKILKKKFTKKNFFVEYDGFELGPHEGEDFTKQDLDWKR